MHWIQYLGFELGPGCNLGHVHTVCPNRNPERFSHLDTDEPMTDDEIVWCVRAAREHGFTGHVVFFRYNEPMLYEERMWALMDRIDHEALGTQYQLWTNGTIKPKQDQNLSRFIRTILTDYHMTNHPVDSPWWAQRCANLCHQHGHLDGRMNIAGKRSDAACWMMHKEFVFDYFGNLHICCYDWKGLASPGNIRTTPFSELVARFQAIRATMNGDRMLPEAPEICHTCKMREAGIPRFVPDVWERTYKMLTGRNDERI